MNLIRAAIALLAILLHAGLAGCDSGAGDSSADSAGPDAIVFIYAPGTTRPIDALMSEFQAATGIGYSLVEGEVATAMAKADVYFGESFVDLWEVAEADLLRPVEVSLIEHVAFGQLADPESRFVPLSAPIRGVVFNEEVLSAEEIRTIADFSALADDRWKGRLCLSSSAIVGNRLLVAHLIRQSGVRDAEIALRRWLANLAEGVFDKDAALLSAIEDGRCAMGILDFGWVARSGWPQGVIPYPAISGPLLLDIRGGGISRHAQNPQAATRLLEWLLSARGNSAFMNNWHQVPLSREIVFETMSEFNWRGFAEAPSLPELGFLLEEADRLIERAGYR
jgi:iron(III) transport system substrate-binding protein